MDITKKMRLKRLAVNVTSSTETSLPRSEMSPKHSDVGALGHVSGGKSDISRAESDIWGDISKQQTSPFRTHSAPDGITRAYINSKVLGAVVPVGWTRDGSTVWVDHIPYTDHEIRELKRRHPDAATMRTIHETKRTFEGALLCGN